MLFTALLLAHSINRWLILLFGLWAVISSATAIKNKTPYTEANRRPVVLFTGTLHLQIILGMMLFALAGMSHAPIFADAPRASFSVEHLFMGVLAVIAGTLASVKSKRAPTDTEKAKASLIWVAASLLTILLAIPWFRLIHGS